ncbi:MAG: hypothetical protein HY431_00130 [Candidatus Levybacteria bacterium]|nr:hypothetical protein [Candidatus Levybacteria bacterium]
MKDRSREIAIPKTIMNKEVSGRLTPENSWTEQVLREEVHIQQAFLDWRKKFGVIDTIIPAGLRKRVAYKRLLSQTRGQPMLPLDHEFTYLYQDETVNIKKIERHVHPSLGHSEAVKIWNSFANPQYRDAIQRVYVFSPEKDEDLPIFYRHGAALQYHDIAIVKEGEDPKETTGMAIHEGYHLASKGGFVSSLMNEGMTDWMMIQLMRQSRYAANHYYHTGVFLINWLLKEANVPEEILIAAYEAADLQRASPSLTTGAIEVIEGAATIFDGFGIPGVPPKSQKIGRDQFEAAFIRYVVTNRENDSIIIGLKEQIVNNVLHQNLHSIMRSALRTGANQWEYVSDGIHIVVKEVDELVARILSSSLETGHKAKPKKQPASTQAQQAARDELAALEAETTITHRRLMPPQEQAEEDIFQNPEYLKVRQRIEEICQFDRHGKLAGALQWFPTGERQHEIDDMGADEKATFTALALGKYAEWMELPNHVSVKDLLSLPRETGYALAKYIDYMIFTELHGDIQLIASKLSTAGQVLSLHMALMRGLEDGVNTTVAFSDGTAPEDNSVLYLDDVAPHDMKIRQASYNPDSRDLKVIIEQ